MQEDGTVLLRVHPELLQTGANLLDNCFGDVDLNNSAIAAQQIKKEPIWDCGAVGNTPPLDPGDASLGDLVVEFGKEPGLADSRLANNTGRLAATVFDLLQKIVQNRELTLAVDKNRHAGRRELAEPGAAMRYTEQAVSQGRLDFAFEGERSDEFDASIILRQQA